MSTWERRLAVLGALTAGLVAAKALRIMWQWLELCLGPVRVQRFKGEWALITGGKQVQENRRTAPAVCTFDCVLAAHQQLDSQQVSCICSTSVLLPP